MSGLSIRTCFQAFLSAIFAAFLIFAMPFPVQAAGPFENLAGSWTGGGNITIGNNPSERIRCRANYDVGSAGTTVRIDLRCASDSYTFELQGNVRYQSGEVRGDWSERTRGAAGSVAGSVKGDRVDVRIEGQTFSALLSLVTRGEKQSISIQGPVGSQMSEATITLNRRG